MHFNLDWNCLCKEHGLAILARYSSIQIVFLHNMICLEMNVHEHYHDNSSICSETATTNVHDHYHDNVLKLLQAYSSVHAHILLAFITCYKDILFRCACSLSFCLWTCHNTFCLFVYLLFFAVYLRSSPEVCYQRLQQRGRKEEKPVTLVHNTVHTT